VALSGNVQLVFEDQRDDRVVTLRADKIVLFLGSDEGPPPNLLPGAAAQEDPNAAGLRAEQIAGVYLEDHAVVSDGDYTVRAPRVYYDLQRKQATLLDAAFYTYDRDRRIPLYVRAQEVRQTSAADFSARGATLSTSAFAVPHFSIGADELTLRRYERAPTTADDDGIGTFFAAKGTTLNAGEQPFFYWPYLAAYNLDTPLRRLGGDFSSNLLIDDSGEDEVAGRVVPQRDEVRGVIQARHRQPLGRGFRVSFEGAFVSDPSFLETFFPSEANSAKAFETSVHVQRQQGSTAVDLLGATRLSDFVEQQDLLQSRGFSVERLPEASHRVIGGSLLDGRVSWFSEARLGQLRIRPGDDAPEDRGFNDADALALFGITAGTTFDQRAQALNLPTDDVTRLDLRQEISLPLRGGPADAWNFTPYAVGRVTAYDDSFEAFNGGVSDDRLRLRGEVGLRAGTQFAKTLPALRSDLLDLDGLRHLVEPSLTFFAAGSTLDTGDLPVFDPEVEQLAEGTGLRLGVTQTLQTRRGIENTSRTVDWLTLRTDLVLRNTGDPLGALPRFDDFRPEFATGGDHIYSELRWLATDTLGLTGELTHDLETNRIAQWRTGVTLEHTPRFSSASTPSRPSTWATTAPRSCPSRSTAGCPSGPCGSRPASTSWTTSSASASPSSPTAAAATRGCSKPQIRAPHPAAQPLNRDSLPWARRAPLGRARGSLYCSPPRPTPSPALIHACSSSSANTTRSSSSSAG